MIDYSTSPADTWLTSAPDRTLRAEVLRGHVRVRLYEAHPDRSPLVGEGWGHTIPHAMAEALNDAMVRQHEAAEQTERDDAAWSVAGGGK